MSASRAWIHGLGSSAIHRSAADFACCSACSIVHSRQPSLPRALTATNLKDAVLPDASHNPDRRERDGSHGEGLPRPPIARPSRSSPGARSLQELDLLEADAHVFKLIGPVLVKQARATAAVGRVGILRGLRLRVTTVGPTAEHPARCTGVGGGQEQRLKAHRVHQERHVRARLTLRARSGRAWSWPACVVHPPLRAGPDWRATLKQKTRSTKNFAKRCAAAPPHMRTHGAQLTPTMLSHLLCPVGRLASCKRVRNDDCTCVARIRHALRTLAACGGCGTRYAHAGRSRNVY